MHNQNNESNSFDTIKDQVIDLLHSNKQEFIYLTGAAGTGKTMIAVQWAINEFRDKLCDKIFLCSQLLG